MNYQNHIVNSERIVNQHGMTRQQHIEYFHLKVAPFVEELVMSTLEEQPDNPFPCMTKWLLQNTPRALEVAQLETLRVQLREEINVLEHQVAEKTAEEAWIAAEEARIAAEQEAEEKEIARAIAEKAAEEKRIAEISMLASDTVVAIQGIAVAQADAIIEARRAERRCTNTTAIRGMAEESLLRLPSPLRSESAQEDRPSLRRGSPLAPPLRMRGQSYYALESSMGSTSTSDDFPQRLIDIGETSISQALTSIDEPNQTNSNEIGKSTTTPSSSSSRGFLKLPWRK